jgi:hypothetical protein
LPHLARSAKQTISPAAAPTTPRQRVEMDLFPDGQYVRLRSRGRRGMYLHANEDGWNVYLNRERASLHAAWRVQQFHHAGDDSYVLLQGAYGRYLAVLPEPASRGHVGRRMVQGVYHIQNRNNLSWSPARAEVGAYDVVSLRNYINNRLLRANGKICVWRDEVSADDDADNRSTMTRWVVEVIPPKPINALELPFPRPVSPLSSLLASPRVDLAE